MAVVGEAALQAQSPVVMSDSSGSPTAGADNNAANEESGNIPTSA
jgi:hypothetical protein